MCYLYRLICMVPHNPWAVELVKLDFFSFCSDTHTLRRRTGRAGGRGPRRNETTRFCYARDKTWAASLAWLECLLRVPWWSGLYPVTRMDTGCSVLLTALLASLPQPRNPPFLPLPSHPAGFVCLTFFKREGEGVGGRGKEVGEYVVEKELLAV